jgi:hypothetical protein
VIFIFIVWFTQHILEQQLYDDVTHIRILMFGPRDVFNHSGLTLGRNFPFQYLNQRRAASVFIAKSSLRPVKTGLMCQMLKPPQNRSWW